MLEPSLNNLDSGAGCRGCRVFDKLFFLSKILKSSLNNLGYGGCAVKAAWLQGCLAARLLGFRISRPSGIEHRTALIAAHRALRIASSTSATRRLASIERRIVEFAAHLPSILQVGQRRRASGH